MNLDAKFLVHKSPSYTYLEDDNQFSTSERWYKLCGTVTGWIQIFTEQLTMGWTIRQV